MPRREETLRRSARETATARGHLLGPFRFAASGYASSGALREGRAAVCASCGMDVAVIPGYSYEILGEAVALNCPRPPIEVKEIT